MYRETRSQREFANFSLPFGGKLKPDNRWVRLADIIPWDRFERVYEQGFRRGGAPGKPSRMALGALLVKEKLGLTDEETVEQLSENPYLQYFIGLKGFATEAPFEASMMVHFRKRIGPQLLKQVNEWIHEEQVQPKDPPKSGPGGEGPTGNGENRGALVVDATCAPQDIRFPTDVSLLNEVREKTERIIDELHARQTEPGVKVRTYRKKARRAFLRFIRTRKPSLRAIRRARREQLQYLRRNLKHIKELLKSVPVRTLSAHWYRALLVAQEVYRQQLELYREDKRSIPNRIVSASQPWVRPMVRGKSAAAVEFGAKVSVSLVEGYGFVERISWEPYDEAHDLTGQIERYRERFGVYPASVHVDKIYRTRANLGYCAQRGIRLSGPRLGRPPASVLNDPHERRRLARIERQDEIERIPVEGKFGEVKRRYGLDRIFEKLVVTSETAIMLTFLAANCEKVLRDLFALIFSIVFCDYRWLRFCSMREPQAA